MKKTLIIGGILGTFAAAAHAQSSVTLYGSLDAGVAYVNNIAGAHGNWFESSGVISDNYFGMKGTEDLGQGTSAIFDLEEGFNLNNGQVSSGNWLNGGDGGMFSRQAWVGLQNDKYGTLKLGKQYDALVDYLSPLALSGEFGGVNLAGHPLNNDNVSAQYSLNNTVKYASPTWNIGGGAFNFAGTYSFSNSTDFSANRAWSLGAGYTLGGLKVATAYNQVNMDSLSLDPTASEGSAASGIGLLGADVQRTFGLGANYSFGRGTVGVLWTHTKAQGFGWDNAWNNTGSERFDNIELNGSYMITPALAVVGNYTYTWGKARYLNTTPDTEKWHSFTLGLDYSFSRRTDVYLAGVWQHTSGGMYRIDGTAYGYGTSIAGLIPVALNGDGSLAENQVAAAVGIRHRF